MSPGAKGKLNVSEHLYAAGVQESPGTRRALLDLHGIVEALGNHLGCSPGESEAVAQRLVRGIRDLDPNAVCLRDPACRKPNRHRGGCWLRKQAP